MRSTKKAKKTTASLWDKIIKGAISFSDFDLSQHFAAEDDAEEGMISFSNLDLSAVGRMRLNGNRYHVAEAMCVNCGRRYCLAWDSDDLLREVECKNCGNTGAVILTGQPFSTIAKRARDLNKGGVANDGEH